MCDFIDTLVRLEKQGGTPKRSWPREHSDNVAQETSEQPNPAA